MLIATGSFTRETLEGDVAVVTGAGRGIGFEAARALAWLGARVIVAEIDQRTGRSAAERINREMGKGSALFVRTDVGSERSVRRLAGRVLRAYGQVDVVVNNATVTPMGAVHDVPINQWDASYRVNLRGPILLAQAFLPGMIARDAGIFVCVSSVGEAYMGAYESLKAAQVHLAQTLDAELEGTNVVAFTVGPGLVRTPGAEAGIEKLAPLYGKTVEEFYAMSAEHIISVEAAGAGFAAAVALAPRFRGLEIGSRQALISAGIDLPEDGEAFAVVLNGGQMAEALALCREARATLAEQSAGWAERPLFERQWMVRDFKKHAGLTIEQWLETLKRLESTLEIGEGAASGEHVPLDQLAGFYTHLQELAAGYEKDAEKRAEQEAIIAGWRETVERLAILLGGGE
jgi:NAD(P)-dependent dehydrogenase (short-subunit alcohol dehydrogenase family)